MARKPYAALGVIPTPSGDVIVRKFWLARSHTFAFDLSGPHEALRWMLPKWAPNEPLTRTQVKPPSAVTEEEACEAIFQRMRTVWAKRLPPPGPLPGSSDALLDAVGQTYATLSQLRTVVESEMSASLRPSTVSAYRYQWKGVFKHIPAGTHLRDLDRVMIQNAVGAMARSGLAPATIRKNIEALNRLLVRAVEDGVLVTNPIEKVKLPKKPKRVPEFLTTDQRAALLEIAKNHGRDAHLLIALSVYLGLRKAEVLALRWEHLDLKQRVCHIVNQAEFTTKNAKNRAIPICDELVDVLDLYPRTAGFVLKPRLQFRTSRYRWEYRKLFTNLVQEAKLPGWVSPHVLRHTFASLAAQAGVSLFKIGAWMGHSSTEVTEIYAHLAAYDPDINRMAPISLNPAHGATVVN